MNEHDARDNKVHDRTGNKGRAETKHDGVVEGISNRDDTPGELDRYLTEHADQFRSEGSSPEQEKEATERLGENKHPD